MSNLLDELNPQQREAVSHGDGPILVFAGAGSGKTRVLTRRIAYLISQKKAHASEILAVTFTNKAANEMKGRVAQLFPESRPQQFWVATFHSACTRILREHARELGFTPSFAIYDRSDSTSALKRVYKRLNIHPRIIDINMVRSRIDQAKNEYIFADALRKDPQIPQSWAETLADIFEEYQQELLRSNAMDFGDLLCNVVTLFQLEPRILQRYQDQFRYLLIDEYQDTNHVQFLLVQMLAAKHHNLCVVGDDDQSIYAFRGATIRNILDFQAHFPGAKVVTLETNYRSTRHILAAANAVIEKNTHRQQKRMRTDNPSGCKLTGYVAMDERDEAEHVVRNITALLRSRIPASEIAVFYRTNAQSRALEEVLCENGLPYQIFGGHRFYERKEIKDILAYYRLCLNPHDNESFLRIINTPTRGIGNTSVGQLIHFAQERSLALLPALRESVLTPSTFGATIAKKWKSFSDLIQELEQVAEVTEQQLNDSSRPLSERANAIAQFLHAIATKTSYLDRLKDEDTVESESRIENIYELMRVAVEFSDRTLNETGSASLRDFLDRASLSSDNDTENTAESSSVDRISGRISLMTLHLAKGLEFNAVFLVGLEEGLLPHIRSLESRTDLEEERRLLYVGMTRAKQRLYLSRAIARLNFGRSQWLNGIPSRFLADIPASSLQDLNQFLSEDSPAYYR